MARYAYQSMDAAGKTVRGSMEAANLPELEQRLKRMELDLIDCKLQSQQTLRKSRGKVTRKDLINFCFYMEQLSGAGVPMLESLADLRDSMDNPRFRGIVADLIENIEGGAQLSEAMSRHPHVFDKTFTSLVAAGEQSAEITEVFRNLADNLKWQDELSSQTKKVITYPAFVGIVVFGVMGYLMVSLVPQLTTFIKSMGQELPLHTRALIFVSGIFVNYWYVLLALPFVIYGTIVLTLRNSPRARYQAAGLILRIPLIGPIIYRIILARFATFFALLYASGITILDCIRLCEEIVANEVVADGLRRARQAISDGQGVTAAFQSIDIFPPLVIRMLKVGEATGSMDTALQNVSYFYNREIKEMIDRVQTLIEPVMTTVLGLLLAWIMVSTLGPIYDTISKVKF